MFGDGSRVDFSSVGMTFTKHETIPQQIRFFFLPVSLSQSRHANVSYISVVSSLEIPSPPFLIVLLSRVSRR